MIDDTMSDLTGTTLSVSDQAAPEITYSDEGLAFSPAGEAQILTLYADMLQTLLNPQQEGVRIEVRFAKVRQAPKPGVVAAEHDFAACPKSYRLRTAYLRALL